MLFYDGPINYSIRQDVIQRAVNTLKDNDESLENLKIELSNSGWIDDDSQFSVTIRDETNHLVYDAYYDDTEFFSRICVDIYDEYRENILGEVLPIKSLVFPA